MKVIYLFILAIATSSLLVGCGGSRTETTNVETEAQETMSGSETAAAEPKPADGECIYSYIHDSTQINWTAYKFESKAGVGGSFKECEVYTLSDNGPIAKVMNGLEFRIPISSTFTKNEDRDKKIVEHFFGTLVSTDLIVGEIIEVSGDNKSGKVGMKITMNGETVACEGSYAMQDDGHIDLTTELDMTNWNGLEAVSALNKVCEDLHREAPGQESKLWPNVSVQVKAYLKKDCGGAL